MKERGDNVNEGSSRRNFLKKVGVGVGAVSLAGIAVTSVIAGDKSKSGEKIKLLSTDGKLVEVDKDDIKPVGESVAELKSEARKGLTGRKFIMVIDLSKCKNARKCVEACQEGHMLPKDHDWMKLYLLQDDLSTARYWFPRPCFHCDKPMCVSVCPVGATYKRDDGIVLIDNQRCIGCKFCMTGCPYSTRVFAWKHYPEFDEDKEAYSPEASSPGKEGTVSKCDFCPDLIRVGKLPYCAQACPMGVIYFGDIDEDTVTNGTDTFKFSELIRDRAGYRYLEVLGTRPTVYYLPPVDRQFPVEGGFNDLEENVKNRYKETPYVKTHKK